MPPIRRGKKAPPAGWELIEPTLDELDAKMKQGMFFLAVVAYVLAEADPHEGKRKVEALWPIFRFFFLISLIAKAFITKNRVTSLICITSERPLAKVLLRWIV